MKLRKKMIWSFNLHVTGDLQHKERYFTIPVEGARSKAAAERKAITVVWKRHGCILADIHVISGWQQTVWY